MCQKACAPVTICIDATNPSGVLENQNKTNKLNELLNHLEELKNNFLFDINISNPTSKEVQNLSKLYFGSSYYETNCFRGYPIFGSFKQFYQTKSKYILHLDCDMIFYEQKDYSWINAAINLMNENEDILCVLPRGGPPHTDKKLHQGTTKYNIDDQRRVFLFKNFTSRHYLIHRERFLSLLPVKPLWLSWREPFYSKFSNNGKMLCWESIIEFAMKKSDFWRADLMTDKAWSVHPGDRDTKFLSLLPNIMSSVEKGTYPNGQKGNFDIITDDWKSFLNGVEY